MANVAIYYSMSQQETSEDIVEKIETLIEQIDDKILGVYIDPFGSSENFNKLISEDINKLNTIYLNKKLDDEFNGQMIYELSKISNFQILYFSDI